MQHSGNKTEAFSLTELSVVLAIIATLVGMTVSSSVSVINTAQVSATSQKMASLDQALMNFRIMNNRLPCPADLTQAQGSSTYGTEGTCAAIANGVFVGNNGAGTPNAAEGGMPTVTLGLPNDFMYDAWGSRIRYAVDTAMTSTKVFTITPVGCVGGAITIKGGPAYPAASTRSSGAVYALISHGPNMHGGVTKNAKIFNSGALNSDELTNCHCDSSANATVYSPTYVQEAPTTQDTTTPLKNFDDIVTYKERWQMQTTWDGTGACPIVWVADTANNQIQKSTNGGSSWSTFLNGFNNPQGLFIDSSSNVWVVDTGNNQIKKYNSSAVGGMFVNGGINNPIQIYVDSTGNVWIANAGGPNIKKYSSAGTLLNTYGSAGAGAGQFSNPNGLYFDNSNNMWVADSGNNRLQKCNISTDCTNVANWTIVGSSGTNPGQFSSPANLYVDSLNNLWVSDNHNDRVQKCNLNSDCTVSANWATWGATPVPTPGAGAGQFNHVIGITGDSSGNIWTTENFNGSRIQKYSGGWNSIAILPTDFASPHAICITR